MSPLASFIKKKTLKIYSLRDVSRHVYDFMEVQTEAIAKWGLKKSHKSIYLET